MNSSDSYNLKPASESDAACIAQILIASRQEYLPYAMSPHSAEDVERWIRHQLLATHDVIVAVISGKNVAVMATQTQKGIGWINQLYLAPGHVRQGIGSACVRYAKSTLTTPIRLWTFQQNKTARIFYEFHGFKAIEFTDGVGNEERCPDVLYEFI